MKVDGVRRLMRREIARHGSQAAWARSIGELPQSISLMLKNREPSGKVLVALGMIKETEYRRIEGATKPQQDQNEGDEENAV